MIKRDNSYTVKCIRRFIRNNVQGGDLTYKLAWAVKSVLWYHEYPVTDWVTGEWIDDYLNFVNDDLNVINTAQQIAANQVSWDLKNFQKLCNEVLELYFDKNNFQVNMPATKELCQLFERIGYKAYK